METSAKTGLGFVGNAAMIAIFIACIAAPGLAQWAGWEPMKPIDERRKLAAFPDVAADRASLEAFPKAFETWYQDHFGLRNSIIRSRNYVCYAGFGVSPTSRVVMGDDGWAFVGWPEARDYMLRKQPASPTWDADWRRLLAERAAWLKAKDIDFVFGVVPESYTMYSEFLPRHMDRTDIPSLQDRILAAVQDDPAITMLDFRPALFEAKRTGADLIYQKLDGHWQDNGAYIAYAQLMNELAKSNPALAPLPLDAFTISKVRGPGGALNRMLSLPFELEEELVEIEPKNDLGPWNLNYKPDPLRWTIGKQNPNAPPGRALVFTDSYGEFLMPYIAQHFRYTHFVGLWHQRFSPEIFEDFVTRANPDYVIWLFAERWLIWIEPEKLLGLPPN